MRLKLSGPRPLDATRDGSDGEAVVVACPPHPQMGGDRSDSRLTAVSESLPAEIDCLRFDYGPWDEGAGEQTDVRTALAWAHDEYGPAVGLFGYSFGAIMALAALSEEGPSGEIDSGGELGALSVLAPGTGSFANRVLAGLEGTIAPVQVVYGTRDETVNWKPVVDRAAELGFDVEAVPADHFFVGQRRRVGEHIASFFARHLLEE